MQPHIKVRVNSNGSIEQASLKNPEKWAPFPNKPGTQIKVDGLYYRLDIQDTKHTIAAYETKNGSVPLQKFTFIGLEAQTPSYIVFDF